MKLEQQAATNVHIWNAHTLDPAANVTNAFSAFKPKKIPKKKQSKANERRIYFQVIKRMKENGLIPFNIHRNFFALCPKLDGTQKKDEWSDFMKCEHDGLHITVAAS